MRGFSTSVLAMATRCFCPPESETPRSPTIGQIAGRQRFDEVVNVGRFGRGDDLGVGRVRAGEGDVLADRSSKRETVSCMTDPIAGRRLVKVTFLMSWPSISTRPSDGSENAAAD